MAVFMFIIKLKYFNIFATNNIINAQPAKAMNLYSTLYTNVCDLQ
jgi:hypothetical protein